MDISNIINISFKQINEICKIIMKFDFKIRFILS